LTTATPWLTETIPDLPLGRDVPQTTSSEESLSWAMQQLETCKQSHKNCNTNYYSASPLPSRVLDVFAADTGDGGVRLHEPEPDQQAAPYVALSHCWGRQPFLRTLSGSLDAHRSEGIAWARLPQTFRDAVEVTRSLGVRYLWIDSLCIVQDDEHDWRREAARMASVYQNAVLVISAAKSQGAYGGLYADLPDRHRVYTVKHTPRRNTTIHLRQSLTHPYRLLSPYHSTSSSSTLPVFTRGWILQERFLSRRILHFGPEELAFECLESSTCQCSPITITTTTTTTSTDQLGAPAWYRNTLDRTARPKYYYALSTWQACEGERELRVCWRRLVEDYTRLQLTFEKDIFPAIAGMAQLMGKVRNGSKYVAGLWEDSLVKGDLLWHVQLPPSSPTGDDDTTTSISEGGLEKTWMVRPTKWRAPSWSWAS
ncbi:heterokaryon incompatibility protein-domain-containing protein, partial [Chaetomium strumarium]